MMPVYFAQETPYTCGPACLRTIHAILHGAAPAEAEIASAIDCQPVIGTSHVAVDAYARDHFPVITSGEDVLDGESLAIANVRNCVSGIGHFIVLFARRGHFIRFYDPKHNEIVNMPERFMEWISGDGEVRNWAVVFDRRWNE